MVEFKEITTDNYNECLKLEVSDNQKNFVASNMYSLAQAWVFHENAYPFAIYADNKMVGFIMMGYKPEGIYNIWRLMIDKRFQGKGYGKAALVLAVQYLKEKHDASEVYISFISGNNLAEKLYESVGFKRTGEVENNQIGMCLKAT